MKLQLSYNKLWKILIDKNMSKLDLIKQAGISSSTLNKLSKGGNVNTSSLLKICEAIDVKLEDIVETLPR
ncbi:helix-turn-helix domain-containing protein [Allofustis seminis]|uniref:helix-turn-helix domain-containing protein n=1 Tax=Allofustis seminis TaxID=166939 RepID=UPI00037E6CA6|nr:helix-turn-helix transcriptional regulator [Allofustis seminis]